jgi:methionyl-tRNA formyltransferase
MALRLIFMGTPEFAVPTLAALAGQGHDIVAVYTREPARAGRGMELRLSPVHAAAERFGLPVRTPRTLRADAEAESFAALAADAAIVVAYGLILPPPVLAAPTFGCLNLHASLLPRWRGAAPINRAIMAGDLETGIAVMRMEEGLDTGPVAMVERLAIGPDMTAGEVHDRLAPLGADLMLRALAALACGALQFQPQADDGVTYARKIANAECAIDWTASAQAVHDHIRGLSPFPGAYAEIDLGRGLERLKVLRAERRPGHGGAGLVLDDELTVACGEGALQLTQVQRAGSKALPADVFLRGLPVPAGARFLACGAAKEPAR